MRDFEKISFEQFKKDIVDDYELYESYKLPSRDSTRTAGYDFYLLSDIEIKQGEKKKIPTGIKSHFADDEMLLLIIRSKIGIKYNLRLCNQVGVVDADYYDNPDNEGHLWLFLRNEGTQAVNFKKGEALVQGIFVKYLTTSDDIKLNKLRSGNNY